MKQEFDNDQNLVNFLKQNQSYPFTNERYKEEKLMNLICSNSLDSSFAKSKYLWTISGAITMGFLLIFGHLLKENVSPQVVQKQETIETFMINTWDGSMLEKTDHNDFHDLEEDWLSLTENNLLYSQP